MIRKRFDFWERSTEAKFQGSLWERVDRSTEKRRRRECNFLSTGAESLSFVNKSTLSLSFSLSLSLSFSLSLSVSYPSILPLLCSPSVWGSQLPLYHTSSSSISISRVLFPIFPSFPLCINSQPLSSTITFRSRSFPQLLNRVLLLSPFLRCFFLRFLLTFVTFSIPLLPTFRPILPTVSS